MSEKTQRVSIVLPLWAYQHMLDHAAAAGVAVSEFIAQAAISFVVPDAEADAVGPDAFIPDGDWPDEPTPLKEKRK